jgi:hypothetical protein
MKIAIEIKTDADPSMVLGLAIEAGEELAQNLRDHDETAEFDENEVSVTE